PVITSRPGRCGPVTVNVPGGEDHRFAVLVPDGGVIQTDGHVGDIVVIRAEAQRHGSVGGNSAKRYPVQAIPRIVTQAIVLHIVVVAVPGTDRQDMRYGVVAESHLCVVRWHREGNIRSIPYTALSVVFRPTFIERHLALIAAGR